MIISRLPTRIGLKFAFHDSDYFFDPTLSENLVSLPDSRQQLEGATSRRVFLPAAPTGDWFQPADSSFLARRTKLLGSRLEVGEFSPTGLLPCITDLSRSFG
jgi:hypothetical protein